MKKIHIKAAILTTLIGLLPIHSFAAGKPGPLKATLNDAKRIVTSPLRMTKSEAKIALGATAVVGGALFLDETIHGKLDPFSDSDPSVDMRRLGDFGQLAWPAIGTLFAIHGLTAKNEKSKETAFLTYETFLISGALGGAIKFAAGRKRPFQSDNSFDFKPGRGDSSFPSGHTTEAFAAATVFSEQYPKWYVVIPSYAAAGAVGFSRIYANQHWASDVLAGAFLGTAVSHALRKWHKKGIKAGDQTINIGPSGIFYAKRF